MGPGDLGDAVRIVIIAVLVFGLVAGIAVGAVVAATLGWLF